MPLQRGQHFLQVPGPTPIPQRIMNAMHRQAIDFSGPEFEALSKSIFADLKPLFRLENGEVFLYASNGHGGWEAAISNVLAPGDLVLLPETGQFSRGWGDMARALGVEVEVIENDWRHAIDPHKVEERLHRDKQHRIKAVLAVHTDTASSVTSDLQAVRAAIDAAGHPALLMVDAIASLGAVDLRQEEWGLDVVVTASQKALMMPPGLAFVGANLKALEVARANARPRNYWDWELRMQPHHYRRYAGTGPEHLVFGLREALDMVAEEGLEGAHQRHARLAEAVRRAVGVWSEGGAVEFNALVAGERSNSVTTIRTADGVDAAAIRRICREHFDVSLGGGLGILEGKAFRIGHMGYINPPTILGGLGAVEATMKALGVSCRRSGVEAAIDWLAETADTA